MRTTVKWGLLALLVIVAASTKEAAASCDSSSAAVSARNVRDCTAELQSPLLSNYDRAMTLNIRGNNYDALKEYDLAISDYTKVISLLPDFDYAYANRGLVKCEKGDCKGALADYDKALSLSPENDWARYGRGIARLRSGDLAGAKADISAVKSRGLEVASAYRQMGVTPYYVEVIAPPPRLVFYWIAVIFVSMAAGALLTALGIGYLNLRARQRRTNALKEMQAKTQKRTDDPFAVLDPILLPWASGRGLTVRTEDRGYVTRDIWPSGIQNPEPVGQRPQLWLGWPDKDGDVEVHIAVGRWKHTAEAKQMTLVTVLDQQLDFLKSRCVPINDVSQ